MLKNSIGIFATVPMAIVLMSCQSSAGVREFANSSPATPTMAPTVELNVDPTIVFTPTTPSPSASQTPLPKLEDPIGTIYELYEDNGECSFPCWWGISPGSTSLEALKQFSGQFGEMYVSLEGPFRINEVSEASRYVLYYSSYSPGVDYSRTTVFHILDGAVVYIELDPEAIRSYKLGPNELVDQFGPPSQIYTGSDTLAIYYQDRRIWVEFLMYEEDSNESRRLCLVPQAGPIGWASGYQYMDQVIQEVVDNAGVNSVETIEGLHFGEFMSSLAWSDYGFCLSNDSPG